MKAVILASGKGTRMMPLSKKIPKPMVRVHGKPILEYILEVLPNEITEITIVTGYLEDVIKNYFGNEFQNKKINYVTQKIINGTWNGLNTAKSFVENEEKFLLLNADDIHSKKSLQELIKHDSAILGSQHRDPKKFGVLEIDENNYLKNIEEKPEIPKTNLVSTGVYVLNKNIFDCKLPESINGEYFLPSVLEEYMQNSKIKVVDADFWLPLGTPQDIINAHEII